jgi:hypothetical protein
MASLPAKRLSLAEKSKIFDDLRASIMSKLDRLMEMVKLNPMKAPQIIPKAKKMKRTAKVVAHKTFAMQTIAKAKKTDPTSFERHLDRAIVASELLTGILDDAIKAAT